MAKRYVIVGGGAAGVHAAETIRRHDPAGKIVLLTEEAYPPYSRPLLTELIAGRLGPAELRMRPDDHWTSLGVDLRLGARVVEVDTGRRRVVLASRDSLPYDALLVATGAHPVVPRALAGSPAVTTLHSLADAQRVTGAARAGRSIVIVGAGVLGVKLACALREAGTVTTLVEALPQPLAGVADGEAALMVTERLAAAGIRVRCGVAVEKVAGGEAGRAPSLLPQSVTLEFSDGSGLKAGLVVACTGVTPAADLVREVVGVGRGVIVDETMRTNVDGVYAAGDVTEGPDVATGGPAVIAIWPHACAQGRVAGSNMAGRAAAFPGALRRNVVDVLGLPLASMGVVSPPASPGWSVLAGRTARGYVKVVLSEGVPVGAVVAGDMELSGRLQACLRKGDPAACVQVARRLGWHGPRLSTDTLAFEETT